MNKSSEGLNSPSLKFPIHGEAVPPAPSACDTPSGDAPSACDIITVDNPPQAQLKPMRVTRLIPNRLVNWSNLQSVVNPNLGPCQICHSKGIQLGDLPRCSFATGLELICRTGDEKEELNRKEIAYLIKNLVGMKIDTKKDKPGRRTVQLKRDHLQRVHKKYYS